MSSLLVKSTHLALWQSIIQEAQLNSDIHLNEQLESYLVFLLMHFCDKPQIAHSVLALEFLENFENNHNKYWQLKEFGDKCLLFAGLFPERAMRKRVTLDYFVQLGQSAYGMLSQQTLKQEAALYEELCQRFVRLMDVLQATREQAEQTNDTHFLTTMTQWQQTGSEYALKKLKTMHPLAILREDKKQLPN
jgi:hypothetical protein